MNAKNQDNKINDDECDTSDQGYQKEMEEAADYAMGAYQSDEWWERGNDDDD